MYLPVHPTLDCILFLLFKKLINYFLHLRLKRKLILLLKFQLFLRLKIDSCTLEWVHVTCHV